MYLPLTTNEITAYCRKCDHCGEELKEVGLPCAKCRLVIHERCIEGCKK